MRIFKQINHMNKVAKFSKLTPLNYFSFLRLGILD